MMIKNKFVKYLWKFGPWILWMAITYYLSDLPAEKVLISKTDWIERNLKNGLHFVQYFGLYLLTIRSIGLKGNNIRLFISLIWCVIFAGSDELHQLSTPNREASLNDWIIDSSGAMSGMTMIIFFRKYAPTLLKKIFDIE